MSYNLLNSVTSVHFTGVYIENVKNTDLWKVPQHFQTPEYLYVLFIKTL